MNKQPIDYTTIRRLGSVALIAFSLLMLPSMSKAETPPLPIVIDGNIPDSGCAGGTTDCIELTDPSGNSKELGPVNGSDTKLGVIHTATPAMLDFTNPNGSTDLVNVWLRTVVATDGDVWLYFAWERDASNGSSVITYEFHGDPLSANCNYDGIDQMEPANQAELDLITECNPWENRTEDDFMIVWDFNGGATDIILRTFSGGAFNVGVNVSGLGYADAELNASTSKGEGAINLSDALFGNLTSCLSVANIISGTITGNSDEADYKDTLLAKSGSLNISNCGTVKITKLIDPNSLSQDGTFSYTLKRADNSAINYDPDTSYSGSLMDGETDTIEDLVTATNFQISEDNIPGDFELVSILCDKPAANTNADADSIAPNTFSVNTSATTNCTIKNKLLTGKITVIKKVESGYGGSAIPSDFCLSLNDDESTADFNGADDPGTKFEFLAGNQYDVDELDCSTSSLGGTTPPGYSQKSKSADCIGTISAGDDKTCTIVNQQDPQPGIALILYKELHNDYGGTKVTTDWTLSASLKSGAPGTCTKLGFSGTDDGTNGAQGTVSVSNNLATCTYELAESPATTPGYTSDGWSCTGDVTLTNGNEITVGASGGSCTVVNRDVQPTVKLVKTVNNNYGGTLGVSDFPLFIDGNATTSGAAVGVSAGNHTASETQQYGYTAGDWGGDCDASGNVTLAVGENKTCTITNSDIQPTLKLVKTVNNNYGGLLGVGDFPLFINGKPATSGVAVGVSAGNHTASETQQLGYTAGDWGGDCDASGNVSLSVGDNKTCTITNSDVQPTLTLVKTVQNDYGGTLGVSDFPLFIDATPATSGQAVSLNAGSYVASETQQYGYSAGDWGGDCDASGNVSLSVGDNKTCTITNSDIQPKLTLVKTVNNNYGGTLGVGDFPLFIGATPATSGRAYSLNAGDYVASETQQYGYTAGAWGGACDANGNVSLSVGDDKTCTITNSDIQPTLKLVKTVNNNYGGTLGVGDFPLFIDTTPATSGVPYGLNAGSYVASETQQFGYTTAGWGGDCDGSGNVSLSVGDTKICTITNTDLQPTLKLVKTVNNNYGGTLGVSDFPLFIDGSPATSGVAVTLSAGIYTASETQQTGYTAGSWGGDCDASGNVSLSVGQNKTCTITNSDIQPKLTLVKTVNNPYGGTLTVANFPLFISGIPATSGVAYGKNAGSYTASETQQAGYTAGDWGGDCASDGSVSLAVGDDKTCTITNTDIAPLLYVVKTPDAGDDVTVAPGEDAEFTIKVYNIGGGDALGVTLDDTLPSPAGFDQLTWTIVSQSVAGACAILVDGVTLDCNTIGTLTKDPTPGASPSGDEAYFEVKVKTTIPSDYFDAGSLPALAGVFEIDGNMVDDTGDGVGADDWGTTGLTLFNTEDPPITTVTGISQDDSFGKGAKEDNPVPSVVDSSVPPNKSDLTNFIGVTNKIVNGNVLLAIGWLRVSELGTASFDFELNQSATTSGNGVTPVRGIGDWLIGFDFSAGGDNVSLTLREWDGAAWGPPTSLDASVALGAVNDPVTFGTDPNNEDDTVNSGKLLDNTFGEALINLTQAFPGGCRNFASAYVKGRSSDAFTSALKDFIAPVPVKIDTCQTEPLPNTAYADAANPGGTYTVNDSGTIGVSNKPADGSQ